MDNGWQMKLPCPSSRVASSSEQFQFQEPRNQMNMNVSHCILPHDAREQGPLPPPMKQAPTSNILNFGAYKSFHPESGNMFHSLLSAPHSHLQLDFQRQSNMHSSSGGCILESSVQGNVGTMPNWPLLQNRPNFNTRVGLDVRPSLQPGGPVMNANNGNSRGISDDLDTLRAFTTHDSSRNERGIDPPLQKAPNCVPSRSGILQEPSVQTHSSVTKKQNSVVRDCPRVFCMGACGDLLLSSTGLFGILCSCHGMHMSVSKFCEHSGLSDVNPGYAVRVDSGESIAQWRKLYLQKFGIRAPGDHRGWDWPEGLLASSGLANSSMAVADRRKVFDLSSLFNSSAESSTQLQKNVSTGSPRPSQECSNQMFKNAHWENNGFEHCNIGSFGKNLHTKIDNPTMAYPSVFRPLLPGGNGGAGDGCQSRSFHFMSSRENTSSSALQNSQSVGSKAKTNLKDDVVLQRSSIPSSIELKLGQPSQLGWGSGSAVPSSVRPQTSGVQSTTVHEKLNCNMENAKVAEINKQHISCHSVSDFSRTKGSFVLGPLNNAATSFQAVSGLTSTNGAAHVEHMESGLHNSFPSSVPGPPSNTTVVGSLYHKKIIKSTTDGHPFSPWTLHHQPRVDRPVMIGFSCNEDAPIRPLDADKLASLNNKSRDMDACWHKESSVSELSSMFYAKQMESSGFDRTRKTCNPNSSASLAASSSPLGMADMLSGVSGASNYIGNAYTMASNLGQDQLSSKLRNSSFSFTTPTVQGTSSGFTPLSAVLTPGHSSISFSKNVEAANTHASEESIRLLALRSVDTLCNGKPMDASHVFSQQPRIHSDHRQQSKTCSIPDVRAPGLYLDQGPFEGQRHDHPFSVGQIVPPSLLPDAVHKRGMNFGANSEKVTLWSELNAKYSEDLCNPLLKQRSPLSGGRQENMECRCNMVQRSHGQSSSCISDMCNCNIQIVCSKREQEGSGSSSMYGLKKQANIAVVETPKYNSSRFFDEVSTGNEIRLEFSQKEKEHHFKSDCGNSQWLGNPSQEKSISNFRCPNASTHIVDNRKASESNLNEHATKSTLRTNQVDGLLKGKELSDNSSGCSAPAVAQASNEVNMIDSVTTNSQIADQGSAISRSCSSVEAIDSVKSSQLVYDGKTGSNEEESFTVLENASLHSVINESKQRYTKSSELQNFTMSGGSSGEVSNKVQNESEFKPTKRKRTTKRKTLETPFTASKSSFLPSESVVCVGSAANHQVPTEEDVQVLLQPSINSTDTLNVDSRYSSLKRRRSALSSVKMLSLKRDLNGIDKGQPGDQVPLEGNDDSINMPENYAVKKLKHAKPAEAVKKQIKATVAGEGNWLHNPICDDSMKCSLKSRQKLKPVACGKYGIICDQESDIDQLKPKIVPLIQVLKASKRSAKYDKPMPSARKKKKNSCSGGKRRVDISFSSHRSQVNRFNKVLSCHSRVIDASIQETHRMHLGNTHHDDPAVLMENGAAGDERNLCVSTSRSAAVSKTKEIRMRSLYDLSIRGNKSMSTDIGSQNVIFAPPTVCGLEMITPKNAGGRDDGESRAAGNRLCRKLHSKSLMSDTEELCCVCGISNKDNANCLLECGHCLIRIHQACYGIARVPKGDWYCRPCRTSSKDVACVLCGYGGGAMTRAFGSRNVVKGLLKAWDIRTEPNIMCVGSAEALYVPAKMECRNNLESATYQLYPSIKPVVHNSIVSGLFDPTVKQWVHMVCGLWTPGTRCPNVDTMSAFDVSGVSHLNDHMVCYICNRAGGSCIRCRVETCHTHFHPWCAHHKGLLQSEVEGDDSDQVGFYGRCLLHANPQPSCSDNDRDTDKANSETERQEEPTCARTEGYKGKKQRGGHYSSYQRSGKGGCLVTQVQLDAWQYINRHKLRGNKQPKPPASDVDHDYRKEYTRYKQAKGWKHLVVYKSGIHALGLYTSQFIQRAAVVVEYVGEIVGPRVADKRETEYMTGRKLQYKSACYFFRIDKEQIIDATCKGGIARFVNHSCQPNCVAKVLTVRGDKKVVFFAERDIYPGEEITYDYHFNHEDEGKKIPCFCNSKNCRRYLN